MIKSFGDFGPWKNYEDQLLDGILTSNKIKVEVKTNEDKKTAGEKNESPKVNKASNVYKIKSPSVSK